MSSADTTILSFDPSSTRTGWALSRRSGSHFSVLNAGAISGSAGPREWGSVERRLENLRRDVGDIVSEIQSYCEAGSLHAVCLIEVPSAKHRRGGRMQGLTTYGRAVGIVEATVLSLVSFDVHRIYAEEWIKKAIRTKQFRAKIASQLWPGYADFPDAGRDVADAVTMAWWWSCNRQIPAGDE